MNKDLSNLGYFRRGIALASATAATFTALGNLSGLLPTSWDLWKVHFFGVETGLGSGYLALLGDGRNPALALVAGLVAWLLLPRERSYSDVLNAARTFDPVGTERVKLQRRIPPLPLAFAAVASLCILFLPALVGQMGNRGGGTFDAGWWVVAGAVCIFLSVAGPVALSVFGDYSILANWTEERLSLWTLASMAVLGAALVGLCFTGWAALAVLAGALVVASPRWIVPPVLWVLRKIFPPREPLAEPPPAH